MEARPDCAQRLRALSRATRYSLNASLSLHIEFGSLATTGTIAIPPNNGWVVTNDIEYPLSQQGVELAFVSSNLVDRRRATDFIGHYNQGLVGRALVPRNEKDPFRT